MDPMERFNDNQNMIITDKELNLGWLPKDCYQDLGRWATWHEALGYIRTMNSVYPGGHSDYRLPTGDEIKSFFNFHLTNSDWQGETIHIHPIFVSKCAYYLWTSDINENDEALRINLRTGETEYVDKNTKEHQSARLCRTIN